MKQNESDFKVQEAKKAKLNENKNALQWFQTS